ncbi:tetratricopeptide repeat protein 9C-like [Elysia marginata]|uniref:Rotamase n=1 Tax=Elysia marginata TaxID=1093978 RepID=A0AAV4FQW7_9GAST|nr:tetratricopeptide repeat protein 9C-like [Elysia marginata]
MDTSSTKLTDSEKLAKIRQFKEKGNAAHKEENFKKAAWSYYRAILYIKGLSSNCPDMADLTGMRGPATEKKMSPEMVEESKKLTCDCYNNLAACMLKEADPKYERVIEHCDKALEVSPSNGKALFRKGISLYFLGQFSEALDVLKGAPQGSEVRRYSDLCKARIKQQDKELAHLYKGMFQS